MKLFLFMLLVSSLSFALVEKAKDPPPPPELKVENTKEKSKLTQIEVGSEVILHHREPVLFPDGRVIEVHYFSHKKPTSYERRRASVGLKLWNEKNTEVVVLTQDLDRNGKETLSSAQTGDYVIKLIKMVYDDQITISIQSK
jgi:hypothetical protein